MIRREKSSSAPQVPSPLEQKADSDAHKNMYYELQQTMKQLKEQFTNQLQQMLDPRVYQQEIKSGQVDKYGRYLLKDHGKEKAIFYYKNILNLLIDSQSFLTEVAILHPKVLYLSRQGLLSQAWTVYRSGFSEDVTRLLEAYFNLYKTIDSFKLDKTIYQLFSVNGIIQKCRKVANLIFPLQILAQQVSCNPTISTFKNQAESLRRILQVKPAGSVLKAPQTDGQAQTGILGEWSNNIISLEKALENILIELIGKDIARTSLQSVVQTNTIIHAILEKIRTFSRSSGALGDMLTLVRALYPLVNDLMVHFPQGYVATNRALKNHLLVAAEQLNTILRDFFLQIDEIESEYYLKEKYLLSLGKMEDRDNDKFFIKIAKEFNDWAEGMNCEFIKEKRFPYVEAIAKQRVNLVNKYQKNLKLGGSHRVLRLAFMDSRKDAGQRAVEKQKMIEAKKQDEQTAAYCRYQGHKLELVYGEKTKLHVDDLSPFTLYLHLHEDGVQCVLKKGNQLERLNIESYKPVLIYGGGQRLNVEHLQPNTLYLYLEDDSLHCVVKKEAKLESLDLQSLDPLVAAAICQTLVDISKLPLADNQEKAILAVAAYQDCYVGKGLDKATVAAITAILTSKNRQQLTEPQKQAIYALSADKGYLPYISKKDQMNALIDKRIAALEDEINNAWILWTKTKHKKIALLHALKTIVNGNNPSREFPSLVDDEAVRRQLNIYTSLRLLYEGRTGKVFQELRSLSASRKDEAELIQRQSAKHENRKKAGFWFFTVRRTKNLQDRIDALKQLKSWLSTPGYRLDDALDILKVDHLQVYNCLMIQEISTLNELRKIEVYLPDAAIGKRVIKPLKLPDPAFIKKKIDLITSFQTQLHTQKMAIPAATGIFGFMDARRIKHLECRGAALEQLKSWLNKYGYHLDNALLAIEFAHPSDYQLIKDETLLLQQIRDVENSPAPRPVHSPNL